MEVFKKQIPLFALESQDPIKDFDFLGITIQYEMCYTNILQVLDLSGIPMLAADRGEDDPIVIGGGPCAYNPEPLADFFDIFYIGEGETVYDALMDAYKANKAAGGSKWQLQFRVCMYRLFMMWLTMKTVPLHPLDLIVHVRLQLSTNR